MTSTQPVTPDRNPSVLNSNPGVRRSFTAPIRPKSIPSPSADSPNSPGASVETLFSTSFARIVAFTASVPASTPRRASFASTNGEDQDNSLPWRSATERTLATGPTSIYRAPHGVSFLQSGRLLHPILPKSQCWCVDGNARFVLRVRADNYYRVELEADTEEQQATIETFKSVLRQVLQFDKTPCPFRGEFPDEAPESERAIKTRLRTPPEQAKKWKFDRRWKPEGSISDTPEVTERPTSSTSEDDDSGSVTSISTRDDSPHSRSRSPDLRGRSPQVRRNSGDLSIAARTNMLLRGRSLTNPVRPVQASPQIATIPSPAKVGPIEEQPELESLSHSTSVDSFYSLPDTNTRSLSSSVAETTSIYDDALPERDDKDVLETTTAGTLKSHRRNISDLTVTAYEGPDESLETPRPQIAITQPGSAPSTPTLMSDSEDSFDLPSIDVPTPPDTIRLRTLTGASQRRAFSPMPPAANIFNPSRSKSQIRLQARHLTTAVIQKACNLLLSPPSHLVELMLRIAAKIAAGFGVHSYRLDRKQHVPGSWESAEDEDGLDEDDFGIPLQAFSSRSSSTVRDPSISRERSRARAQSITREQYSSSRDHSSARRPQDIRDHSMVRGRTRTADMDRTI